MPRFRCTRCGPPPAGFEFAADDRAGQCPRCNRSGPPAVFELCDVHFMVLDSMGPITGSFGRQYVACQPKREHLSMYGADEFAATDHPPAVTCPACRRTREWLGVARLFAGLLDGHPTGGMTIDGSGCCG